jgi:hypothetical protein
MAPIAVNAIVPSGGSMLANAQPASVREQTSIRRSLRGKEAVDRQWMRPGSCHHNALPVLAPTIKIGATAESRESTGLAASLSQALGAARDRDSTRRNPLI